MKLHTFSCNENFAKRPFVVKLSHSSYLRVGRMYFPAFDSRETHGSLTECLIIPIATNLKSQPIHIKMSVLFQVWYFMYQYRTDGHVELRNCA